MKFNRAIFVSFTALACCAASQSFEPSAAAVIADTVYTRPAQLIEIEPGRKLNLYCAGSGFPTVVFDSGQAATTVEWALVQPKIARNTRVCSYDRAGFGFSSPARRSSSSHNIVDDMRMMLRGAGISPPYVLVGHSYGGMNVKLYAYEHPDEVAGLVFVDPSHEDQRERYRLLDRRKPTVEENESRKLLPVLEMRRRCIAGASNDFASDTKLYEECVGPPDPRFSAEINAALINTYMTATYHEANMSEEENMFKASANELRSARRQLGDVPLVVLTSDTLGPENVGAPLPTDPQFKLWVALHDDVASLSSRGTNRIVRGSRHNIQTDQPGTVVKAILDVLGMARGVVGSTQAH